MPISTDHTHLQLHVLSYSLHYLLLTLSTPPTPSSTSAPPLTLSVGDLDPCLELISSILIEDLFGAPAEERESGENIARIPESKTPQSYNSYEITSRFLSPRLLPDLLAPVKEVCDHCSGPYGIHCHYFTCINVGGLYFKLPYEDYLHFSTALQYLAMLSIEPWGHLFRNLLLLLQVLEARCNSRACRVVEEVFRRVAVGIQSNLSFTPEALLIFVYEVLSDSIPQLALNTR